MATWIVVNVPDAGTFRARAVAYCPTYGKWVAVGFKSTGGARAYESEDGLTWTQLVTGFEAATSFDAVGGIDLPVSRGLVVINSDNTIIEMDSSGAWTTVKSGLVVNTNTSCNPLMYLPGAGFCLYRKSGSGLSTVRNVYTSNDGVTWAGPATVNYGEIATIKIGLYFILFESNLPDGKHYLSYSSDGATWNDVEIPFTQLALTFIEGVTALSSGGKSFGVGAFRSGDSVFDNWVELSTYDSSVEGYNVIYHFGIDKLLRFSKSFSGISDTGSSWDSIRHPKVLNAYPSAAAGTTEIVVADQNAFLVMKGSAVEADAFNGFVEDPNLDYPSNLNAIEGVSSDKVSITFSTDNPVEVDGYAIIRNDGTPNLVATVVNSGTPTDHTIVDTLPLGFTLPITYSIFAYSTLNQTVSATVSQIYNVPTFELVGGSGGPKSTTPLTGPEAPDGIAAGIDLGGAAATVFILNPSGIYTIVPGLKHDVLYERMTGITTQNVKIPEPFVQTAFIGDSSE